MSSTGIGLDLGEAIKEMSNDGCTFGKVLQNRVGNVETCVRDVKLILVSIEQKITSLIILISILAVLAGANLMNIIVGLVVK